MKRFIVGCSIGLTLLAALAYAQYLGSATTPMYVYFGGDPTPNATEYGVVRLTDGTNYYTAGGSGGGDGKILDGTTAGQADVLGSAPGGSEQALVVRNIPSGTQTVSGSGTFTVGDGSGPLTVDGTVTATGPLTDTQLRASAVPVSGPLTDAQLRASAVPVSGPLTDTQLRASAVPVVAPTKWTCALDNIAGTLTQCQAAPAAGQRLWLTSVVAISTTGTAATFAIRQGTGANCGTSTAGLLPGATTSRTYILPANTGNPIQMFFPEVGIGAIAANAICVIGAATNTLNITLSGYTAP